MGLNPRAVDTLRDQLFVKLDVKPAWTGHVIDPVWAGYILNGMIKFRYTYVSLRT
jgi:hypothetical protein